MTKNQIAYRTLVEQNRTNRENERIKSASQVEEARHNLAFENETQRHNKEIESISLGELEVGKQNAVTQRRNAVVNERNAAVNEQGLGAQFISANAAAANAAASLRNASTNEIKAVAEVALNNARSDEAAQNAKLIGQQNSTYAINNMLKNANTIGSTFSDVVGSIGKMIIPMTR